MYTFPLYFQKKRIKISNISFFFYLIIIRENGNYTKKKKPFSTKNSFKIQFSNIN